ncbi:hypothetical protein AtubIFM55763_007416 [Aspergillus tubingensis]|uniref:Carboxylic ester hydrolase n=2 Tax=Aspergillus subgen. Circumdati TaxID=2720871 RepID=A0A100IG30_ASPNG|nr:tannase [Aspergillus tubingensis]GAQ40590.1 tannase, putative [Aspergillus niger]GFN12464.1 tannase [Aspergillus tubingensis]GLA56426.1 hypothetical protein AtubIFM54640_000078 [Aspergillus tubingensis]GLA75860.1 hypothetical protein AtubIFM55763_007416 [Aspergillus tubingensis]GLA86400.1 hypothetical protein AtubIFM56815_010665 [Aspergillus tubingensis]
MSRLINLVAIPATLAALAQATSLDDVCTTAYSRSVLPDHPVSGVTLNSASVHANPVYNYTSTGTAFFASTTFDYCNVTMTYSHDGLDDEVNLHFWLPTPDNFANRWLSTGGFAYAINQGTENLPEGIMYGAAAGITDGGFGGFDAEISDVFLKANGTINRDALYMFGYQAHYEMSAIGKAFTRNFFNVTSKLYAYYQGCSEGGREGWSQVQRFADEWDGAVIGAPAIRYGQQQANHLFPPVAEKTLGYYPPTCELDKIHNMTITACDALDGKEDGVVARTDLCKLHFNINSTIGASYYCESDGSTPAQNGSVTAKGAALVSTLLEGLHTLDGRRAYIWYQPSADLSEAEATYNSETGEWEADINTLWSEWVTEFLGLSEVDTLTSPDNVTYDDLYAWMKLGWQRYEDVLQTTWPDLSPFRDAGGKIIHVHGESDPSIPAGSSVHYHESVRQLMYPDLSFNSSSNALNDWNRLYLVPGGAHCSYSDEQPNGGWPLTTLLTLIDWVENGVKPDRLNNTVQTGSNAGEQGQLCVWPTRPYYRNNGTELTCVFDQESYETWVYDFDAYDAPLY